MCPPCVLTACHVFTERWPCVCLFGICCLRGAWMRPGQREAAAEFACWMDGDFEQGILLRPPWWSVACQIYRRLAA